LGLQFRYTQSGVKKNTKYRFKESPNKAFFMEMVATDNREIIVSRVTYQQD
jgi:hypothetical protein